MTTRQRDHVAGPARSDARTGAGPALQTVPSRVLHWFRRSFITGFFVLVPVFISVLTLLWIFRIVDGSVRPIYARYVHDASGQPLELPGLGPATPAFIGLTTTAVMIVLIGALASNVFGRRQLEALENWLMHVPVFRTVYAPVKQLVEAFSPDNEYGFKRVVMVDVPQRGVVLGFLTKEFTADRGQGPEALVAVYVPTNHLYLGDVLIFPQHAVTYPDLTVEEGVRVFLTGGMALPGRVRGRRTSDG